MSFSSQGKVAINIYFFHCNIFHLTIFPCTNVHFMYLCLTYLCPCWLQHAVGYVGGEQYYGAKASLNVWAPHVNNPNEFSISQMWVISGSFGNDLNTIEAGWQVLKFIYYRLSP